MAVGVAGGVVLGGSSDINFSATAAISMKGIKSFTERP